MGRHLWGRGLLIAHPKIAFFPNFQPTLDNHVYANTSGDGILSCKRKLSFSLSLTLSLPLSAHTHQLPLQLLDLQFPSISTVCDANLDMVFMLDQSGSVGRYNHDTALYFLEDVVSFYNVAPNATQVP